MNTTIDAIVQTVCRHMGIEPSEVRAERGQVPRRIAARRLVCYLARRHAGASCRDIGRVLGTGHTTAVMCDEDARQLIETGEMLTPGHPCDRFVDVVHDIERALGLPLTPAPEHAEV